MNNLKIKCLKKAVKCSYRSRYLLASVIVDAKNPTWEIPTVTDRKLCLSSQTISSFYISVTCLKLFHLVVLCVLREILHSYVNVEF